MSDESTPEKPQETTQEVNMPQEDSQHVPDAQATLEDPRGQEEATAMESTPANVTPPVLDETQVHAGRKMIIAKQLAILGHKPRTRGEYEDTVMSLVGLLLRPDNFPLIIDRLSEIITARARLAPAPIPDEYLVDIKGKQHVLFAGLLAMAHDKGLLMLSAEFISVTSELALAKATATFQDGRSFTEAADATPANVGPQVKPHFARMALTRAKARCLRDALNIFAVSAEEVE